MNSSISYLFMSTLRRLKQLSSNLKTSLGFKNTSFVIQAAKSNPCASLMQSYTQVAEEGTWNIQWHYLEKDHS